MSFVVFAQEVATLLENRTILGKKKQVQKFVVPPFVVEAVSVVVVFVVVGVVPVVVEVVYFVVEVVSFVVEVMSFVDVQEESSGRLADF